MKAQYSYWAKYKGHKFKTFFMAWQYDVSESQFTIFSTLYK